MLDRPVRRAASPFPSRSRSATKRRVVVGILVVLSLALLSVYFRESDGGALHTAQGTGATVLRPFQVGAERVARPFRDLYGWFDGLLNAKDENERLRAQNEQLRQAAIENQSAVQEVQSLKEALDFKDLPGLAGFRQVNTRVLSEPTPQFAKSVVVAAGSDDGIREHAPVLAAGTLVGEVTDVAPGTSRVTLVTDESSAVSAYVIQSNATGLIESGEGGSLVLNNVGKEKDVRVGYIVATAGSRAGELPSLFPRGIPIGTVTSVSQTDTEPFKLVQLEPNVDLSNLHVVTVLVR